MKKLIWTGVFLVSAAVGFGAVCAVSGCATLRTSNGGINWPVILTDAQFGITEACTLQALNPTDCAIATDAITTTQAIIAKNPSNIAAAVKQSILDIEAALPANSPVRPYLDFILTL